MNPNSTLGQRHLGDAELHRAGGIGNAQLVVGVDLLQPLFLAGGNDDLAGRDAVVGDQFIANTLEVQCLNACAARQNSAP